MQAQFNADASNAVMVNAATMLFGRRMVFLASQA